MPDNNDFYSVLADYKRQFGMTFSLYIVEDRDALLKMMLDALAGKRKAITDADFGIPPNYPSSTIHY